MRMTRMIGESIISLTSMLLLSFSSSAQLSSSAQTHEIDSLTQAVGKEKVDSVRVMLFRDLSIAYRKQYKQDLAFDAAKEGLELAQRIHFKKGEAALLNIKANVLSFYGKLSEALKLYFEALQINEQIGNYDGMSRNLNNIAGYYNLIGDGKTALSYYLKAQQAAEEGNKTTHGKLHTSDAFLNIGRYYLGLKLYDSAKTYIDRYYELGRARHDVGAMTDGIGWMGMIYSELGQYEIAMAYYRSSLSLWEKVSNNLAGIWNPIAELFEKMGNIDSAMYYCRKAAIQYIQMQSPGDIARIGKLMASLYKKQNKPDSAFYYLEIAMAANDTVMARNKTAEVAKVLFNEKLKEDEKLSVEKQAKEERIHNLQYGAIAVGLVTFLILFFLFSHSIIANQRLIKFLGILALLIVFEFLNLLSHPYIGNLTHHSPVLMLGVMVCLAAMLIPFHHWLEHWITHKLVENNNRIRLAAAKKVVAKLENEQTN
jgi:tetratricopeptide (TPR) repeat protein